MAGGKNQKKERRRSTPASSSSTETSKSSQEQQQQQQQQQQFEQDDDLEELKERIMSEAPDRGSLPAFYNSTVAFRTLPLSQATLRGLEDGKFSIMTAIQRACIPHALAGRDILGAARTGSGKTLAFLIPLLERLFHHQWSARDDGMGALVLSPTRELAVQIFQVLRTVGAYHSFTAGLLVGGKREFHLEQRFVGRTNIIIATPGRLLQHLEQTPDMDPSQLQVLVLDEADRILDMGFRTQMMRILEYLPSDEGRQTMLFSATQTRKVSDLAALSLSRPEYLGVHDKEKTSTPQSVSQSVVVVPLEHKLNAVYSFVKTHLKQKSIVFMASCSQVRHAWQLFCALQPGIPVMALHGKLVQEKRTRIYLDFFQRQTAVLFATDVAARGLDFQGVDWVVQMDAPDDAEFYIHRVGRTGRYKGSGKALLMVLPQEEKEVIPRLRDAKIPVQQLKINPARTELVTKRAAAIVASNVKLKELAQKAFTSYLRSLQLQSGRRESTWSLSADLPLDDFAASLGLANTPPTRFLDATNSKTAFDRDELRAKKNINYKLHKLKKQIKAEKLAKRIAKLGPAAAAAALKEKKAGEHRDDDEEDDDEVLVPKRKILSSTADEVTDETNKVLVDIHQVSTARKAHKRIRIDGPTSTENKRIVFDDDGNPEERRRLLLSSADGRGTAVASRSSEDLEEANEDYMRKVRERLSSNRQLDEAEERERVREKHRKKRLQEKEEKAMDEDGMVVGATLATSDGSSSEEGQDDARNSTSDNERGNDSSNSSDDGDISDSDSSSSSSGTVEKGRESDGEAEQDGGEVVDVRAQEDLALAMIRGSL